MQYNVVLSDTQLTTVGFDKSDKEIVYDPYPISQNGQPLDLTKTKIHLLPERIPINFELIDPILREHAKAWISFACKSYSNFSLMNHWKFFKKLEVGDEAKNESEIEETIEQQFRELMTSDISATTKSVLRTMYSWFVEECFPFFDDDFFDLYLDVLKFGTDDGKGKDVIMELPNRGPLTLREQRLFREAMASIDTKSLSIAELQGLVALKIGQVLGARDIQVIKLSFDKVGVEENGVPYIQLPRAKQRGHKRNSQFKKRVITNSLYSLVTLLRERYESELGKKLPHDWPLLCNLSQATKKPIKLSTTIHTYSDRIKKISEKLGLNFKVTNRRLRKTFCTQLIAKGTPLKVVAELMDHTDLQQLEVYYRHTHHVAKKLDDVLQSEAKDIIDAFAGKIVNPDEASQAGQQIFAPTKDQKLHLIGSCANKTPCSLNPPLSCYGCASLEAFDDVDHKSVVENFVSEAKETFGEGHAIEILKHKDYLAASKFVQQLEDGEL